MPPRLRFSWHTAQLKLIQPEGVGLRRAGK
jgi:hypothetical protein